MKTSVSIRIGTIASFRLAPMLLAAGMLTVSACHHQPAAPHVQGLVVSEARLVLPPVKGNPGAAYFTLGNDSNMPATLVSVAVVGARLAEMHETSGATMGPLAQVRIDPGQQVMFAPGGKHVMVFNLASSLSPGGSGEIVLHFQDGKTATAPLRIAAAGDASGMAGMAMSGAP